MERHLTFLVDCCGAFGNLNELKVCSHFAFKEKEDETVYTFYLTLIQA